MTDAASEPNCSKSQPAFWSGAVNLLQNCVGAVAGEKILIIGEEGPDAFFKQDVCHAVAEVADELGMESLIEITTPVDGPDSFPQTLKDRIAGVDHTIFFSRVGDQVRFVPLPGSGSKTMCYTRDAGYLADPFGQVPHGLFVDVLSMLMQEIQQASRYRITCGAGTNLVGVFEITESTSDTVAAEFTVRLFPELIFPPLSCAQLSGRLALGKWLLSTSTVLYDDSLLIMDEPLTAVIEAGRIVRFEGNAAEVERVEKHLQSLVPDAPETAFDMNSWHTGIYPKTYFDGDPVLSIESWADIAFGSPRYTHFHICGRDPGMASLSLFDATISFDDQIYWSDGHFTFLERPDVRELLATHGCSPDAFEMGRGIGL